jgi:flagella basal body P-ring formation protein FlgA
MISALALAFTLGVPSQNSGSTPLTRAFEQYLAGELAQRYTHWRLEQIRCPDFPLASQTRIQFRNRGTAWIGRILVDVEIEEESGKGRQLLAQAHVAVRQTCAIAEQDLPRGTPLAQAQLRFEERWIHSSNGAHLAHERDLGGWRTRSLVRAGTLLTQRYLEAIPLVFRQQQVLVETARTGMHIALLTTALDQGAEHETIRVKNPFSGQILRVKVTGPGKATLAAPPDQSWSGQPGNIRLGG